MKPPSYMKLTTTVEPKAALVVEATQKQYRDTEYLRDAVVHYGVRAYYDLLTASDGKPVSGALMYMCWNHEEKHASCSVFQDGGFKCFGCNASGDAIKAMQDLRGCDFITACEEIEKLTGAGAMSAPAPAAPAVSRKATRHAPAEPDVKEIDDESKKRLEGSQAELLKRDDVQARLSNNYGVSVAAAMQYGLGWDTKSRRLWIPISYGGKIVNIRKHDIMRLHCVWQQPDGSYTTTSNGTKPIYAHEVCQTLGRYGVKSFGIKDHNRLILYPGKPTGDHVVLTGGELKAIMLRANGIDAYTVTGGEGGVPNGQLHYFDSLSVDIAVDNDAAGRKAADTLALKLGPHASKITIVRFPIEGDDVTDHYRRREWDLSDWKDLDRDVVVSKDEAPKTLADEIENQGVVPVDDGGVGNEIQFGSVHDVELIGSEVTFNAMVVGGYNTAKAVISGAIVECIDGRYEDFEECKECRLPGCSFKRSGSVGDDDLIELASKSPKSQLESVLKMLQVNHKCNRPDIQLQYKRVMPIAVAPVVDNLVVDKDSESADARYFAHPIYYTGEEIPPANEPVRVAGRIIADPRDSRMTAVSTIIRPVLQRANSVMTEETNSVVRSMSSSDMVADMEAITGITGQPEMLLSYMLLFFMPVVFEVDGRTNGKQTAEICVIGDTRQGKSTAMKVMQKHMKAGTFISCEGASFAGLIGGLADFGGSIGKMFAWGPIPMSDGGLVFMDEFDGLVTDGTFGKMTSIRSDGVASRIVAGVNNRTNARVRFAWAANPIGNRDLHTYDSTLSAVRELIKTPQDLARFEFFIGVHRNNNPTFSSKREIRYTSAVASNHVRWAWAQKMRVEGFAVAACDAYGSSVAARFKGLPTLPLTEARWKIARIACAFALMDARTTVEEQDAYNAAEFLTTVYESGKTLNSVSDRALDKNAIAIAVKSFGGDAFRDRLTRPGRKGITKDALIRMHSLSRIDGKLTFEQSMNILCDMNPALHDNKGLYYPTEEFLIYLESTRV